MRQFYLILCVLLLITNLVSAQSKNGINETQKIYWSIDYKLKWSDFKARNDSIVIDDYTKRAATATVIKISGVVKDDSIKIVVYNIFYPLKSWVSDSLASDSSLLAHEQLHFDISELYVRMIRKRLEELSQMDNANKEVYLGIVHSLSDLHRQEQHLYDKQTFHGLSKAIQKEWSDKISEELLNLSNYQFEEYYRYYPQQQLLCKAVVLRIDI